MVLKFPDEHVSEQILNDMMYHVEIENRTWDLTRCVNPVRFFQIF